MLFSKTTVNFFRDVQINREFEITYCCLIRCRSVRLSALHRLHMHTAELLVQEWDLLNYSCTLFCEIKSFFCFVVVYQVNGLWLKISKNVVLYNLLHGLPWKSFKVPPNQFLKNCLTLYLSILNQLCFFTSVYQIFNTFFPNMGQRVKDIIILKIYNTRSVISMMQILT